MATELARIGFAADTTALSDAKQKLEAIVPAAQKAAGGAERFKAAASGMSGAAGGAAAGFKMTSAAASDAARGLLGASTAMGTVQRAAVAAGGAIKVAGLAAAQFGPPTAAWEAYRASLAKVPAAAVSAESSLKRLGAAANDNINRLQSTPGNIAAQFQDIGVTAAGGMQPYLIALQQGTQLSAAMQGGLGNLAAAFGQLLSPVSLITIALVGVVAALIQQVDWMNVAKTSMDGLATAMEVAAPYAAGLGAVLLLAFAPQILGAITSVTVAIGRGLVSAVVAATQAMIAFSLANPFTAIVLFAAAAITAVAYFSDTVSGTVRKVINFIIGAFMTAFDTIKNGWRMFPAAIGDYVFQAANAVIRGTESMINGVSNRINAMISQLPEWAGGNKRIGAVRFGEIGNPFAGAAGKLGQVDSQARANNMGKDWVGKIGGAIEGGIKWAAGKLRGFASGLGAGDGKTKPGGKGSSALDGSSGKSDAEKQAESFEKMRLASEKYVRSKEAEIAALGMSEREAAVLKHTTDLTNQAIQQGIPLTKARTDAIKQWAASMADADVRLKEAQGWKKLQDDMAKVTQDFVDQKAQIGLTAEQTSRYKWETVWLRDALKGVTDPAHAAALREFARGAAESEIGLQRMREQAEMVRNALNFAKDSARGFLGDLKSGLESGKGVFKSFADAVGNMLDKVINKLMDLTIDAAFAGNTKGSTGFISALTGLFTGGSKSATPHAKGAVITGPAMFAASGGAHQMGESGPEGILPLKRGSDGSLGVQMHGGRGTQQTPTVNVTNHYTIAGAIDGGTIAAQIRQSAEQTAADVRRSVPAVLAEYQSTGTVAA